MIQQVIKKSIKYIDMYYNTREQMQNAKIYNSNLIKLSSQTEKLKKALELHFFTKSQNLKQSALLTSDDQSILLEIINDCGEKVAERALDAATVATLDREAKKLSQRQQVNWEQAAREYSGDVVNSLNNISSLLNDPESAQNLRETITGLQSTWPLTNKDVELFVKKVSEGKTILDSLPVDDPNVEEFIKKLRAQEATIDDLDDKVLSWIRENNLEMKIKLSFAT